MTKNYAELFKQETAYKISEENAEKMIADLVNASGVNLSGFDADRNKANVANEICGKIIAAYRSGSIENKEDANGFFVVQKTKHDITLEYRMPLMGDFIGGDVHGYQMLTNLAGRLTGRGSAVIEKLSGADMRVMLGLSGFFTLAMNGI
ncbi:MAG: hypothetical protein LBD20_02660 [Spirochaetaceae bacterium]|jgi:hypothetical protein|nr:hypothetical protein [Spirochaetaceae bacterium]